MTEQKIREFNQSQLEWYKKEVDWTIGQIKWESERIKELKEEDKKALEFAWNTGVITPLDFDIFGKTGFTRKETKKAINRRAKLYRDRKYFEKMVAHYTELVNA